MNLGFIGLGAMGELIVPRLMAAGHTVTGWNRSRGKAEPLIKLGMRYADTPRRVAENSEIIFSIVTDADAVRAVALGDNGIVAGLRRGGIYIDMSTIDPDSSRAVAAEFAKAGSVMLDGPLSGSPVTVKAGNASIMIGGDEAAYERVKPVLLAIGPKVTRSHADTVTAVEQAAHADQRRDALRAHGGHGGAGHTPGRNRSPAEDE